MTKEEKELLLKDICSRLPHRVKVNISASIKYDNYIPSINDATIIALDLRNERCNFNEFYWDKEIVNVRPYLRPMSSMTEEEKSTYLSYCECDDGDYTGETIYFDTIESFDYLNQIHVDYRNLIPKGLALEAPKGMYNIKTE